MLRQIFVLQLLLFSFLMTGAQQQVYELRTYHLEIFRPAEVLHDYLEKALIPALNRQGVGHVGVFEETSMSLPAKVYVLISHNSIEQYLSAEDALLKDSQYQKDAASYLTCDPAEMPYSGMSVN